MSGRDLFTFNPDLGGDSDDDEGGDEEEEDWDMALMRIRTENERREKEVERYVPPVSAACWDSRLIV